MQRAGLDAGFCGDHARVSALAAVAIVSGAGLIPSPCDPTGPISRVSFHAAAAPSIFAWLLTF